MPNKPEFDLNLHKWKVVWQRATFWFDSEEEANTFYMNNGGTD